MKYGSRAWLESQYQSSQFDPWGLEWRPSQHYRYRRMLDVLEVHCDFPGQPFAVDIGCATGVFTEQLARRVAAPIAIGIDISETAISRARALRQNIEFECCSIERAAEMYPAKADVLTCLETIYYLPPDERKLAVSNIAKIVKSDGLLLASSMLGKKPYLDNDEFCELISPYFEILETGTLCVLPLIWVERFITRMAILLPLLAPKKPQRTNDGLLATIGVIDRLFAKCLGRLGRSHTFLVARRRK